MATKRILILVYIATVLAISGFAKAADHKVDHGTAHIESVKLDAERGVLSIHATAPNPCHEKALVRILKVDAYSHVIQLAVLTVPNTGICAQVIQDFDLVYDLQSVRAIPGRTYTLEFENYVGEEVNLKYTAPHVKKEDEELTSLKQSFKGNLAYYTDRGYVIKNGSETLQVIAPRLPLEHFQGNLVRISGYVVVQNNGSPAIVPMSVSAALK
ncbi:MAG: hypothetical protein SGI74_07550 [Oligoflexia bacterium]|nr:hypothetical protein [Oligoflexia bacterium]